MKIDRVCVFCASSTKCDKAYIEQAARLGEILAQNNIAMNYGGGEVGLMGAVADAMLPLNGKVTGIIPRFMVEVEWAHKGVEDMVVTETMAERKTLLASNVDAVIVLPGGTGTLEEVSEVLSNKKLGLFTKPIIIVNTNEFYTPLIDMLTKMIDEQFMRKEHSKLFTVINDIEEIIPAIKNSHPWSEEAIKIAAS